MHLLDRPVFMAKQAPMASRKLSENTRVDVAVVGGGITGLTAAWRLAQGGLTVALVDAGRIGEGTTGASTGMMTLLPDAGYAHITKHFGLEGARKAASGLAEAIAYVRDTVHEHGIECRFERLPAIQYAENIADYDLLDAERSAAFEAGLPVRKLEPEDFPHKWARAAFALDGQAQLDPYAYAAALFHLAEKAGVHVFQHTRITKLDEQKGHVDLMSEEGHVLRADSVILASHTPIMFNVLQTLLTPYRSYVVALELADGVDLPAHMAWDNKEIYHYTRPAISEEGTPVLLVGGEDHIVGEGDEKRAYARLEKHARERYRPIRTVHRWAANHYASADGLPLIGPSIGKGRTFVATGFAGDGIAWGTLAAIILSDEIRGIRHPLYDMLLPTRAKPMASAREFISQNANVARHWLMDRFKTDGGTAEDLLKGEGKLLKIEGRQVALYRDGRGELHALSPRCTHMGCTVAWNPSEKSWDCPCHGGRYSATGEILDGPPTQPLKRLDLLHDLGVGTSGQR